MSETSQQTDQILRHKQLSFKTKLVQSKYKRRGSANRPKQTDANIDVESLRNIDPIQVACNNVLGQLFKKKFGSGGKGKCILEEKSSKWMTPIEFESFSGKASCRDWRRTVKVGGIPLMDLLELDILICHAVSCACAACNENEEVIGPIRPMVKYRRRKKDEILAQNAFKKFLSLKPPTLLAQKLQNLSEFSKNSPLLSNRLAAVSSCSISKSETEAKDASNTQAMKIFEKEIHPSNLLNAQEVENFKNSMLNLEKNETKKFDILEKEANSLISQAQNLQLLIQKARKESEISRQNIIEQFFNKN